MEKLFAEAANGAFESAALELARGDELIITHRCPLDVVPDNFSEFFSEGSSEHRFIARTDLLISAVCENGQIINVRQVRAARLGAGWPIFWSGTPQEKQYKFFRWALKHHLKVEPDVQARHGLQFALMYRDETIVPAFSLSGTRGWLLNKERKDAVSKSVPKRDPNNHQTLYIRVSVEDQPLQLDVNKLSELSKSGNFSPLAEGRKAEIFKVHLDGLFKILEISKEGQKFDMPIVEVGTRSFDFYGLSVGSRLQSVIVDRAHA